jgi:hypothetical protein
VLLKHVPALVLLKQVAALVPLVLMVRWRC